MGISEHGGFVINLHSCPPDKKGRRGGYCTVLPISPLSYRQEYPTRTNFVRKSPTRIIISDDHGSLYTIQSDCLIIDKLVQECIEAQIPKKLI